MSPVQTPYTAPERSLAGYRDVTRAMLRHLMLEQKLPPGHPLVVAYNAHLEMSTASAELDKVADSLQTKEMLEACYTGCSIKYSEGGATATSIDDEWSEGCE
uniref:Uncharacterized protein n=1 Tax=Clastoptera arizonana TaxID=38151 RepID=A0A1B6D467_9HEMI